jgi:spoIIIJ-associated protein
MTKREIESTGSDVEAAIAAGLRELGVEREAVKIKVVDEGSRGLLGIGARPARVRLSLVETAVPVEEAPVETRPEIQPASERESVPAPVVERREPKEPEVPQEPEARQEAEEAEEPEEAEEIEDPATRELKEVAPIARQTLDELLEKMGIQADIEDYIKPSEEEDDYPKLVLNVRGRDLGVLIGRRGDTLDSLEYLTRLIVGREVERRVFLVVDVEGYRVRRERSLRKLAQRMADRASKSGRRQVLEPMSPAERRIIHVELRERSDVETQSVGQGQSRKVTIRPQKK